MEPHRVRTHVAGLVAEVGRNMFGLDAEIRLCLAALYAGGHVLLEGNPGVGKTELVKTLGRVLGLLFNRIQFTPDLMPADITGTEVLQPGGRIEFKPGPIFASIVLADEINRATPKTQSAMLEAMAEKRVTVLGKTYELPKPFIVLATQNPIDHEGTYNLPAAQSDRFMFKVRMPAVGGHTAGDIVDKRSSNWNGDGASSPSAPALKAADAIADISRTVRDVSPLADVKSHIVNLYLATNRRFTELQPTMGTASDIEAAVNKFQFGISPRAAGDIMLGAKAWVCMVDGTVDHVAPFHLQQVVIHALRHRLRLSEADDLDGGESSHASSVEAQLEGAIRRLCFLTAPKGSEYGRLWQPWASTP